MDLEVMKQSLRKQLELSPKEAIIKRNRPNV